MQKNNLAEKRIDYLFRIIETSSDADLRQNALTMINKIRLRHNIRLNSSEKSLFCNGCEKLYKSPKIRFRKATKNGKKYLQKIIICDSCGCERRISIKQ